MHSNGNIEVLTAGPEPGLAYRRQAQLSLVCTNMSKSCKYEYLTPPFTVPVGSTKRPSLTLAPTRRPLKGISKAIFPSELASKLESEKQIFMLLDCRPSLAFGMTHIRGSISMCCTRRLCQKRLKQGKMKLVDLISSPTDKTYFRSWTGRDIILYDEHSTDIDVKSQNNGMSLVASHLMKDFRDNNISYLAGGLCEFRRHYSHLCDTSVPISEHRPLYSPTTPVIEPEIETAIASRVLPFLYIGNERDAANLQRLEELNISYVLNVTSHIPFYFEGAGITYKRLPATDCVQQNLKQYFADAIEFIEECRNANSHILIHCQAGVSRSATITIAYLLKHSHLSLHEAYNFVKKRRQIISPNLNFMGQLLNFELNLKEGEIERIPSLSIDVS